MRIQKGNYKGKHPSGTIPDPEVVGAVKEKAVNGEITCSDATDISVRLSKPMIEVGAAVDMSEIQIIKCQLGLFGYYPQQKIVSPAKTIDPGVEEAINNKLEDGSLSCYDAWEIAKSFSLPKMSIASACEAKGIKIRRCQLGAF